MKNFLFLSILAMFAYSSLAQTTKGPREMCLKIDYNGPKYVKECKNYYIKNCCDYPIKITYRYYSGSTKLITKKRKIKSMETFHVAIKNISGGEVIYDIYAEDLPQKKK